MNGHMKIYLMRFLLLDVEDRVPINIVEEGDNSLGKIYFFTNIRNLSGERITHRWIYQGRVMAEVSFNINGPRWRVWSSKNLWHTWIGEWRVEVLTDRWQCALRESI